MDFVTDIRRMAAVADFDKEARQGKSMGESEVVYLRNGVVAFNNKKSKRFIDMWIEDVAGLQDTEEAEKLTFPSMEY